MNEGIFFRTAAWSRKKLCRALPGEAAQVALAGQGRQNWNLAKELRYARRVDNRIVQPVAADHSRNRDQRRDFDGRRLLFVQCHDGRLSIWRPLGVTQQSLPIVGGFRAGLQVLDDATRIRFYWRHFCKRHTLQGDAVRFHTGLGIMKERQIGALRQVCRDPPIMTTL